MLKPFIKLRCKNLVKHIISSSASKIPTYNINSRWNIYNLTRKKYLTPIRKRRKEK